MPTRAMLVALALTAAALSGIAPAAPTAPVHADGTPDRTGERVLLAGRSCAKPGGTLIGYGHSYLRSPRIGGASSNYASLAAAALGAKPVIRAVDQGTTADVERLVRQGPTRWVPGSAQLVVIDSGINDIGRRVPTARWTASLRRTLEAFATHPVPTILLVRPLPVARAGHPGRDPKVVDAYAAAQRSVAAGFSAVRIVDAGPGWDRRRNLSRDGLHPNNAGMAHLAKAVQSTWVRSCKS